MLDVPDVRYARGGGVAVAYQVIGSGPRELVFVPFLSNLMWLWQLPALRRFLERLAAETRLTLVNPRGMGLSDRPRSVSLEGWMDDIKAVLDQEELEHASVLGTRDSANAAILLAATYPERVERLILHAPFARLVRGADYEFGEADEWLRAEVRERRDRWGDREFGIELAKRINPQWADDDHYLEWFVWNQRFTVSPAAAAEFYRMQVDTDITDVLGSVRVPTLVVHAPEQRVDATYVAERISSAQRVEVAGVGMSPAEDDAIADATLGFVRGEAPRRIPDSVLATLLFTDLVGSTHRAAELGDRAWRDVLERHHAAVRREVARFRGAVIDTAGDGFFCRFDGPARAIACAREIVAAAPELGLAVRAGVHTGECELALEKLVGLSVVIGARVAGEAAAGEVLVSRTVKDLVAGSGLAFEDRGERELKGVPGSWRLYAVAA